MAIAVTAYEYYGLPTGDSTTVCASRTPIADVSLKGITDPLQLYYPYDIQRPPEITANNVIAQSMKRYIAFRITGSYSKLKNVKIVLKKPSLYQKSGGVYSPITDNSVLQYNLTNEYVQPESESNVFGVQNGKYDGTLNIVTADITLFPRLSSVSPVLATSRQAEYLNSPSYWTEFLVLQGQVYPGACDNVGTFGKTGGTDIGSITGPLVSITIDEIGTSVVN